MNSIGILEDNNSLRQTIVDYLLMTGKYEIAFSEGSFNLINKKLDGVSPDLILLDIHLSDVTGIDIIGDLKKRFADAYIIIITGDKEKDLLLKAIEKGANGYLYKPFSMAELTTAINTVNETGSFLEPEVLTKLFTLINQQRPKVKFEEQIPFTQREVEILGLLKKGHTYNEMAEILNLSFHTINHHIKNLYLKTKVKSKSELIVKYYRNNN